MFETSSTDQVEAQLVEMAGHLAAGTCRFLQLLAEFDTRKGWSGPGLRSCAHWLGWRVGLNLRTARDHLRVAHALTRLPQATAAFAAGTISYSKVRALTRIATPATEDGLLNVALHGTTSQLESLVAAARANLDPRPAAARRYLRHSRASDGSLLVSLRIPAEQGDAFLEVIESLLPELPPDEGSAEPQADTREGREQRRAERERCREQAQDHTPGPVLDPVASRRLDALLDLVLDTADEDRPGRDTTLVVHLRADERPDTQNDRPAAWIEGGPPIHPVVAGRLTCTAAVQALLVDRLGNPLHLGRTRRTATRRQLRALRVRDRGHCVFPGCDTTRRLEAHHLRWWQRGGPTDLDNLALVCWFHHTLIHDHGYQLIAGADGFTACRPDGTPVPATGPPTRGHPDQLVARHTDQHIDDWTITPHWYGERLDRDYALAWLLPELDREAAVAA